MSGRRGGVIRSPRRLLPPSLQPLGPMQEVGSGTAGRLKAARARGRGRQGKVSHPKLLQKLRAQPRQATHPQLSTPPSPPSLSAAAPREDVGQLRLGQVLGTHAPPRKVDVAQVEVQRRGRVLPGQGGGRARGASGWESSS